MSLLKKTIRKISLSRYGYILYGGAVSLFVFLGLLWFVLFYGTDAPGRNELLIGRLHPVVVHLPIGILLAVFLYELTTMAYPELRSLPVALFLIWIGFLTAVVSALAGFFLSFTGGYDASYLFWHKWLGVLVAGTSGICFLMAGLEYLNRDYHVHSRWYRNIYRSTLVCMVVILSITGHLGGTLTHGPGYLTEYLPTFVKAPLGLDETASVSGSDKIQDIQKAKIYGDLVKPVLEKRCVSCHGPSKKKGGLRLDSKEGIKKGGENGKIIEPGNPENSELVRVITLPPYHEKVMPPDNKKPLSIGNTELFRWWVATGASFEKTVSEVDASTIPAAVQTKFDRIAAKPEPERFFAYETDVSAPDKTDVQQIKQNTQWKLSYLSKKARFLEVRYADDGKTDLKRADLEQLNPIREQLVWLYVRGRNLTDDAWAFLEKFPMLNQLHAQRTNMQDKHLKHLSDHEHLVYLNIHHTTVSDTGLDHLNLENLEKLFVWETKVTEENVKRLREQYSNLSIDKGFTDIQEESGDPKKAGIVKNMKAETGGFKMDASGIDNGTVTYSDRDYTFVNVPDELRGNQYILTPNHLRKKDRKDVSDTPLLTLELESPATVYLAYDTRTDSIPDWVKDNYEPTDMTMGLEQFPDFKFRMYKRDVPAGKVTFGANAPDDYDDSKNSITMFSVVLAEKKQ